MPSVHICDWRDPTRNDFDRALPGDGIIDLPAIFNTDPEAKSKTDPFTLSLTADGQLYFEQDPLPGHDLTELVEARQRHRRPDVRMTREGDLRHRRDGL